MKNKYLLIICLFLVSSFAVLAQQAPIVEVSIDEPEGVCFPGDCTTLSASYTTFKPSTDYIVESINYQPLFAFDSPTATQIPPTGNLDDFWIQTPFTLPFPFCFYGNNYTQLIVGSNGILSFDLSYSAPPLYYCQFDMNEVAIPSPSFVYKNSIYGVYQDIDFASGIGSINYEVTGTYPNRVFVMNVSGVPQWPSSSNGSNLQTTQIVLYETTNIVDVLVKRRVPPINNSGWPEAVLGIQNAAGTKATTPPNRNTGFWTANNEAWRFTPSGTGPESITFEWKNQAGTIIGTGQSIQVCPTADETYTVKATFARCDGSLVSVSGSRSVVINPPLPVLDPVDMTLCTSDPAPYVFPTINQDTHILNGASEFDYEIYYFKEENMAAAYNKQTSQALSTAQQTNFSLPNTDPYTIYVLIIDAMGSGCHNVRSFTLQGGNPSGDFSYPDDGGDPGYCISGVSIPPVLNNLTAGGTYTISPTTGLTIDPDTGTLNLTGSVPGTYTITYTIPAVPGGCPEWSATPVTVLIEGCVSTTPVTPTPVCEGTPTFDLATSDAGVGATYTWKDYTGAVISNVQNPTGIPVPTAPGDYTYTVFATKNSVDSTVENVILKVHPTPTASFISVSTTICTGATTPIQVQGTPGATVNLMEDTTPRQVVLDATTGLGQFTTNGLTTATTITLVDVVSNTTPACNSTPSPSPSIVILVGLPTATMVGFTAPVICSGTAGSFTIQGTAGATVTYTVDGGTPADVLLPASGQLVVNTPVLNVSTTTVYAYELTNIATPGANGCSDTISGETATLTVNALPTASFTTSTPTVCQNTPATINFTGTPGATVTYIDETGANDTVTLNGSGTFVLTTSNLPDPDLTYTYTLVSVEQTLSGVACSANLSGTLSIDVDADPVFVSITPVSPQLLCIGDDITLEVFATGENLSYQWYKEDLTNPVGTNASTLTILDAASTDAGEYFAVISGSCGAPVTSTIVELELNQPTVITDEPDTQTVCEGQAIVLEVVATGVGLSYKWYKGLDLLPTYTGSTLTIPSASLANAGTYRCEVINSCQTVSSQNAVVTVNELPAITVHPQTPPAICVGGSINLSVTATGTGLAYQWYNGTTAVGPNSATLNIPSATIADAGNYTVVVSGACTPAVTSNIATVVVNQGATITQQTQASPSDTVCSGTSITLRILTIGGTNVSYQWMRGTTPVGTNSPTLTINPTSVSDTGVYTCVVTSDSCGSFPSDPLAITVDQAPVITKHPDTAVICEGVAHQLKVEATGTNLTYQWYKGTTALPGEVTNTYAITSATLADSGTYYCVVSNTSCGDRNSSVATLTVRPLPVATIAIGGLAEICSGESSSIVFQGTPGAMVTYNIVGVLNNETALIDPSGFAYAATGTLTESTTYELVSVTYTGAGACSQALTGSVTVVVHELPEVTIEDGYICVDPVTLAVTRTYILDTGLNEGQYIFEWSDASGVIPAATSSFYEASAVGQYSVMITDRVTLCDQTAFATVYQSSPPISFTYTVNDYFSQNPTVTITAQPAGDYEYQLDYGPFQESNVFDNISQGEHTITVRDPQACDVLTQKVVIIDYPKYFTPNGDGIHDTWNISSFGEELNAKIYIFDRFGKLVKEISTKGLGWDGTFNGQLLPATDYWFTLDYEEKGIRKEFKAHFSMKR